MRIGVVYEPSTGRAQKLSDAAEGRDYRRALSYHRRHRAIASILRTSSAGATSAARQATSRSRTRGSLSTSKPSVTLSVPADPDSVSSFMNIRVADIQACYKFWRSRGAEFITEPQPKYG